MVKHTRQLLAMNHLSVLDHFVGLELKVLSISFWTIMILQFYFYIIIFIL